MTRRKEPTAGMVYACSCGHQFDVKLGKYGCPDCCGIYGPANLVPADLKERRKRLDGHLVTGYWGEPGTIARGRVHLKLAGDRKNLCGWVPRKAMEFQWCAVRAHLDYVDCRGCRAAYQRALKKLPTSP